MERQEIMAETKPAAPSPTPRAAAPSPTPRAAEPKTEAAPKPADPSKGLSDEIKASHHARITVPGRDGVDARLDNRSVEELETPVYDGVNKPQHVNGPDVAGQVEFTRKVLAKQNKG